MTASGVGGTVQVPLLDRSDERYLLWSNHTGSAVFGADMLALLNELETAIDAAARQGDQLRRGRFWQKRAGELE